MIEKYFNGVIEIFMYNNRNSGIFKGQGEK